MYRILRHERFSEQTFLWEIEAPDVARAALQRVSPREEPLLPAFSRALEELTQQDAAPSVAGATA